MSEQKVYQDKIIIRDLLVQGIIGIYPEERVQKQDILVNIVVTTDISQAAATEDLYYSVNYAGIAERVTKHIENGKDLLVERLALDLARMILVEFSAETVQIRIEKPQAIPTAAAVGVEIVRSRADFV